MTSAADSSDAFNPFPGLRSFETEEYNLFFGREGQSDELLARLGRARLLAVVGTSGSGKSSLVRAGLLPALYGGLMAGAGSGWRVAVMRPGHDPVGNLAQALAAEDVLGGEGNSGMQAAMIEATLRRSTLGLVDAARQARLGPRDNLLVVVDQFEELFRYKEARAAAAATDDDAAAFVRLLLEATAQRDVPVYVVITMRSDFLGDCAQFWGLPEAINDGQYLIPRMTRDERREAVTGPAAVGGGQVSPPLVNRLLNDMGDSPDQLPIMQHALMRTWDYWAAHRRDSEPLGVEHYEAVGTMAGALSRHADEAFAELPDERSRQVAEVVFKRLTERGVGSRETRRPTPLRELCAVAEASEEEVASVVETFRREGRSFLMPPEPVPLTPDTVIDISHESLIRNWGRLKGWAAEEALSARVYRRLAEAAALHAEGAEGLLNDPGLQIALDWREKERPNAAWAARYHTGFEAAIAYLDASRDARDARLAAEREREQRELESARAYAEQKERDARRVRRVAVGLGVVLIFALAAAGLALYTWRKAVAAAERERLSRRAAVMIETFEMEEAEAELNKLYDMLGDDDRDAKAWVLWNLGYLNDRLERFDRAAALYHSALETQEQVYGRGSLETVGMLESLANALQEQRSYPQAVARYEQLLSILNGARRGKDKYFQLNTAHVHSALAQLYVDQALFEEYDETREGRGEDARARLAESRRRALEQYRQAFAIWEEVLAGDPESLASKYVKASKFYREILDDPETSAALEAKADDLIRKAGIDTNVLPLGQRNPGNDPAIVTLLPERGPGFTTYEREPGGADQYARAETVRAVLDLAAAWAARHPRQPLAVGDLSRRGGGPFPPHADHQNGREVDIRPLTNDGLPEPTNIFAPNYSPELTRELVELIKQKRPDAVIRFNDPRLVEAGLVRKAFGHDDYLHVRFP
ncbi:MAG TPA: penicillin-insensitive murein endopeptidase [Pyrinomonadaceae bacterium]|nr:penicillin-insensitive murein endopeptidase [Pyrinomonadaceae bacterium]